MIFLTSMMILPSCGNQGGSESSSGDAIQEVIKREVILSPEAQDMLNRFPTPLDVTTTLQAAKAPYIFSLCNPPANLNRYFTEKTKALNLGVYSTDLAYSSVYQRADETDKFLFCTGKLAGDLGIGGVYDKDLLKKAESYKNNRDSLVSLARTFFRSTTDFLRKNNRTQVAVLVASGAFTEGLYITSSLCQFAPGNLRIREGILAQKENLDNLIVVLGAYGSDSNIKPVADEMSKLKKVFDILGVKNKPLSPADLDAVVAISGEVRDYMTR
ncbi:MAG: hypothetical protein WCI48_04425 [Bacteroidota bacterium]